MVEENPARDWLLLGDSSQHEKQSTSQLRYLEREMITVGTQVRNKNGFIVEVIEITANGMVSLRYPKTGYVTHSQDPIAQKLKPAYV
ncbi:MAG: hypothetical protein KGI73_02710 [Patescibacteria group bacterium]|nr:hypothetical protein [Patescibacteria group bacterium]